MVMTAKKQKEKRDQRAIDEKKRFTVKMQTEARDKRARDRGKLLKEKQVSGDSSSRTTGINRMIEHEKKRLTVKMQTKARDKRARDRGKLLKEKQVSGDSSSRTTGINRMIELNLLWRKQRIEFWEKYRLRGPIRLDWSFVEKPFGSADVDCDDSLASNIVSLALFDGKNILFACSGIAMEPMAMTNDDVTIIVTSKRLVTEFNHKRDGTDKLRIKVLFPCKENMHIDGFLGLYDEHIAVVTCFYYSDPFPVHVNSQVQQLSEADSVVALGRAFNLGTLMSVKGQMISVLTTDGAEHALIYSNCAITEAGLGGPVTDMKGHVLGLNIDCDTKKNRTSILPWQLLHERLLYFEKYTPNSTNFREYTLPHDLFSIVPSGHWCTVQYLMSLGYPKPPPLVLEIGGKLCNKFEEDFGDLYGYEGLDYNPWYRGTGEDVFSKLQTEVVTKICQRVVLLTSYNGDARSFACTGYLIKWHKEGTPVILTSASLIRSSDNENKIDEKLKIDVFLPPNQHATGTLELYHSDYNIAVISVQTRLRCIHPENIFHTEKGRKKVVAIGREVKDGVLMGTIGVVAKMPMDRPSKLDCKDLKLSTCKIKKAGIGGPLVNFIDGSYAGMNFYDGTTKTPYLPRRIIAKVLSETDLPSQIGMNHPTNIMTESAVKNRWPVPKPYWYHPLFDV